MSESPPESQPLLHWLLLQHPKTPKTRAKQWIQAGRVSVCGSVVRRPHEMMPDPGNELRLLERDATSLETEKEWQIHPRVGLIFLDGALAVVNKGPGLISVPAGDGAISALSILADFLAGRLKAKSRGTSGRTLPPAFRKLAPLPVHRLDQYTSGVLCLAMNAEARRHLIDQLTAHTMQREYVAFADGRAPTKTGTWRHWLRLSENETRQHIVQAKDGAQEAVTHFEVMEEFQGGASDRWVTKLRLRLETGRKHQIRAQAAHVGLPLLGDRAYHPAYRGEGAIPFSRQALHAEVLTLEHLQRGKRMTWKAELPSDLQELEGLLRKGKF